MRWLALLLAGCAAPVMSVRAVDRTVSNTVLRYPGNVGVETETADGIVAVRTRHVRRCYREVVDTVEVRRDGHVVERRTETVARIDEPCAPEPAGNQPIRIELADGSTVDGETDDLGSFIYFGTPQLAKAYVVVPRAPEPPIAVMTPAVTKPLPDLDATTKLGFAAIDDALAQCAPRNGVTAGVVRVKLVIDAAGKVMSATPDRGTAEFQRCLAIVLVDARFTDRHGETLTVPFTVR